MSKYVEMIREELATVKARSAWKKGVLAYADDLLDDLDEMIEGGWEDPDDLIRGKDLEDAMLNGASDWKQFSWGGSSLIYNGQIAERLCSPSELKKTKGGERRPNAREEWLDCQARALYQAAFEIRIAANRAGLFSLCR